jgi:hypothetical protein
MHAVQRMKTKLKVISALSGGGAEGSAPIAAGEVEAMRKALAAREASAAEVAPLKSMGSVANLASAVGKASKKAKGGAKKTGKGKSSGLLEVEKAVEGGGEGNVAVGGGATDVERLGGAAAEEEAPKKSLKSFKSLFKGLAADTKAAFVEEK